MAGFAIRTILFLAGLIFLLVILIQGIQHHSTNVILASSAGLFLVIGSVWLGSWKIYQCAFTIPEEIRIAGHVRDRSNLYLNDHLVIVFREKEELGRDFTHPGNFVGDKKDEKNDGYFEFNIPNTDQLTRCSMVPDFRQASSGRGILGFGHQTIYIWHDFADVEADTYLQKKISDRKTEYILEVIPGSKANLPKEVFQYPTYLNQNGNVTIDAQIKTYTGQGISANEYFTNYYVHSRAAGSAVRNAWVIANSVPNETSGPDISDNESIDIDNCKGLSSIIGTQKKKLAFMREVQFEKNTSQNFDLGTVAFEAIPSLGFTPGEIVPNEATVDINVAAGEHKVYKITWHVYWKYGTMRVDSGQQTNDLLFRASYIKDWTVRSENVACP
jgi:hypothetical protein